MKKKTISLIMIIFLTMNLLVPASSFAAPTIQLLLNDLPVSTDVPPIIENGRTLVPIRIVTETLGCQVDWNQNQKTATIRESNGYTLSLTINKNFAEKTNSNGRIETIPLDVPAKVKNGRTLVPMRFIAENLSLAPKIGWNHKLKQVCMYTSEYIAEKNITDLDAHIMATEYRMFNDHDVVKMGEYRIFINETFVAGDTARLIKKDGIVYMASEFVHKFIETPFYPMVNLEPEFSDIPVGCNSQTSESYKLYFAPAINFIGMEKTQYYSFYIPIEKRTFVDEKTLEVVSEAADYSDFKQKLKENGYELSSATYGDEEKYYKTKTEIVEKIRVSSQSCIMYNYETFVPMDLVFPTGATDPTYGPEIEIYYNEDTKVAYVMERNYRAGAGKSIEYYEKQKEDSLEEIKTEEAANANISVGEYVFAYGGFYRVYGNVTQIKGDKAKVKWTSIVDLLGETIEYKDLETMEKVLISNAGIVMESETWVDRSKIYIY